MITVPNYKVLQSLPRVLDGEVAFCEKENATYIYSKNDNEWRPVQKEANLTTGMTLYDLNKTAYAQVETLSLDQEKEFAKEITEWSKTDGSMYFMLLCKELSYYTVLHRTTFVGDCTLGQGLIDCANSVGYIKGIEHSDDKAYEIWVYSDLDKECYCMYLFPYDMGIVEVEY